MIATARPESPARPRALPALLLAALATVACSSIPEVDVPAGSRVEVRLYDAEEGYELALANASHPELHDVYSERRADGSLKLAPDRLMGQLLASLERAGLERWASARPGGAPDPDAGRPSGLAGAPSVLPSRLDVGRDGAWSTWLEPGPGAEPDERRAFVLCKLLLNEYYSKVGGMQFVSNPEGSRRLRDQQVEPAR